MPLRTGEAIPERRLAELERAAELLGVSRLALLGLRDAGMPGRADAQHQRALAMADQLQLARDVAEVGLAVTRTDAHAAVQKSRLQSAATARGTARR